MNKTQHKINSISLLLILIFGFELYALIGAEAMQSNSTISVSAVETFQLIGILAMIPITVILIQLANRRKIKWPYIFAVLILILHVTLILILG